jgi:Uma2 family endonuclease
VVIEVLSDSTEQEDRTAKFALYLACPSVQEYMLIVTAYRAVEVYRRAEPRWTFESYGSGDTVVLESIDVRLPVDQLYRLTDVPLPGQAVPASEGATEPHGTA